MASDRRRLLKIKLKSLAEESRLIRREEIKIRHMGPVWRPDHEGTREEMYLHRIGTVRHEARDTLLAYSYIRGRKYKQIEPFARTQANWKNVYYMVHRYGNGTDTERDIEDWFVEEPVKSIVKRAESTLESAAAFNP